MASSRSSRCFELIVCSAVVLFSCVNWSFCGAASSEAPEPFEDLHGFCSSCGTPQPFSGDPLVRYTWNNSVYNAPPQIYRVHRPASYKVLEDGQQQAFVLGAESLLGDGRDANISIKGRGCLFLDWGVERAAWLEFESPDLTGNVSAAISEFRRPYPGKTQALTKYGRSTYRLETNKELYEGVRYTWICFDAPLNQEPWHITKITLVAKVKPIQYTGSFNASDDALSRVWYTGAYGVRLNIEENDFNSILIDRGDRDAIQGDGHPTMAAALVAFAPYELIRDELNQTNSGDVHGHDVVDQQIMAYPIYWTMSVNDWFMASGDVAGFRTFAPDCMSILNKRIQDFLEPNLDIFWFGWDDRIGNGWCGHAVHDECNREAHLAFAGLVVRACRDLARSLHLAGMEPEAKKYEAITLHLGNRLRQVPEWPRGFGVHSAANAINAGIVTDEDVKVFFHNALNDSVNICSHSPFNQYWILQALGNADMMDHAIASIKLCWEPMLELGRGCFWELFSPEWASFMSEGDEGPTRPSYCHPWSSGVTAWLSNVLGGIESLLPGYAEYVATPYVSARNPSVGATVPTPAGSIAVNAVLSDERKRRRSLVITIEADVPGFIGIRKQIAPGCVLDSENISVDGIRTTTASAEDVSNAPDPDEAGSLALWKHFVSTKSSASQFLRIATGGRFTVTAAFVGNCSTTSEGSDTVSASNTALSGIPHIPPFPIPHYPATTEVDRESHGDGLLHHGSDGYVLFGYDNGTDVSNLPNYIQNVSIRSHDYAGWTQLPRDFVGVSTSNAAYLPDPRDSVDAANVVYKTRRTLGHVKSDNIRNKRKHRSLGEVSRFDSVGWDAGLVLEVEVADKYKSSESEPLNKTTTSKEAHYWLSIYCVAKDDTDKHAIRLMDLESLNVIAPTVFVSNYTDGVWWRVRYHKSTRLRFMTIHNIRVSAVAFSTDQDTVQF